MVDFNRFGRTIPYYADKFLVWGNMFKDYVTNNGIKKKDVEVIGSPFFDNIILTQNERMKPQKKFILLATSSPFQNLSYDLTVDVMEKYLASIQKICEIVLKLGKKLVIKQHPHPDEFDVTQLVKGINQDIIVIKNGDIIPLIKSCEIFITMECHLQY